MAKVVVFGGTTEGRQLMEFLDARQVDAVVTVVTDYGMALLPDSKTVRVSIGPLPRPELTKLLEEEAPKLVIDATHPYAAHISGTLRDVCGELGLTLLQVERDRRGLESMDNGSTGIRHFEDLDALIHWLNMSENLDQVVFSTLGAKEASALASVNNYEERVWVRILPLAGSLEAALSAGIPASHIICMQGPFSVELNTAMLRQCGATVLLTKESGKAGGVPEKIEAAQQAGAMVAVLPRPDATKGLTLNEIKNRIEEII